MYEIDCLLPRLPSSVLFILYLKRNMSGRRLEPSVKYYMQEKKSHFLSSNSIARSLTSTLDVQVISFRASRDFNSPQTFFGAPRDRITVFCSGEKGRQG